jgi:pyridoxine kinase
MGVETAAIPTAVLSTHTGSGFSGYTFRDLTEDIPAIAAHWKKLGLKFDAIYTGYIGSREQVEVVKSFISDFRTESTVVVVDPVMGDGGKMYPGFDGSFVESMKSLCSVADCILPNATETALLLGKPYNADMTEDEIIESLHALTSMGCETAVITGASCGENHNGAMAYSRSDGRVCRAFCENIEGSYHSTGDIFSGVVSGGLTLGMDLQSALELAVSFTHDCIKATLPIRGEQWYAVRFEPCLGDLANACKPYISD